MRIQLVAACCVMFGILSTPLQAGKKITVRVIDKVDNAATYTYVVPGSIDGSRPTTHESMEVRGATLALQLPDGRVAVVNCDSKVNWGWSMSPRRDCRVPTVSTIEAEFDGDKVKLSWRLGIDGEKGISETYKLLVVLDKR